MAVKAYAEKNNIADSSVNKSALRIPGLIKADTASPRSPKERGDDAEAVETKSIVHGAAAGAERSIIMSKNSSFYNPSNTERFLNVLRGRVGSHFPLG